MIRHSSRSNLAASGTERPVITAKPPCFSVAAQAIPKIVGPDSADVTAEPWSSYALQSINTIVIKPRVTRQFDLPEAEQQCLALIGRVPSFSPRRAGPGSIKVEGLGSVPNERVAGMTRSISRTWKSSRERSG